MSKKKKKNEYNSLSKKEIKRNKIIQTAEKLFFKNGYDNTTMQEIADELKIAKGTLYIYFQSKQDIYIAILAKGSNIMNNMFNDAFEKEETGWDKLRSIGLAFLDFCDKYEGYADFLFNFEGRIPENYLNSETKSNQELKIENTRTMNSFMEAMKIGFQDKSIRSDMNPMKLGIMLSLLSSSLVEHVKKAEDFIKKQKIEPKEIIILVYDLLGKALKP